LIISKKDVVLQECINLYPKIIRKKLHDKYELSHNNKHTILLQYLEHFYSENVVDVSRRVEKATKLEKNRMVNVSGALGGWRMRNSRGMVASYHTPRVFRIKDDPPEAKNK
jgi:hypothetical protein